MDSSIRLGILSLFALILLALSLSQTSARYDYYWDSYWIPDSLNYCPTSPCTYESRNSLFEYSDSHSFEMQRGYSLYDRAIQNRMRDRRYFGYDYLDYGDDSYSQSYYYEPQYDWHLRYYRWDY